MSPFHVDWRQLLAPSVGLLELFVRGSITYLGILFAMRLFRRQKGALNTADLLVLVIIADAAQNSMSANYNSITEGAVLVGSIFFWDWTLDALSYKFPVIHKLLNAPPLLMVRDGVLQHDHMRKAMLTAGDVMEQLRLQGVSDIRKVKQCFMEADGHFSILKRDDGDDDQPSPNLSAGIA